MYTERITNPEMVGEEMSIFRNMLGTTVVFVESQFPPPVLQTEYHFQNPQGHPHRVILAHPSGLLEREGVFTVGFIGDRKNTTEEADPLEKIDRQLIARFPHHPGLLTYSTKLIPDRSQPVDNFANLALFSDPDAAREWWNTEGHQQAIALSPKNYTEVVKVTFTIPGRLKNFRGIDNFDGSRYLY